VDTAASGETGLELAKRIPPDAFVIDYRMPGIDGFELTRRIKSDTQLKNIPVLLLTGADAARNVVDGLATGADDYVTKSADPEILFARLHTLLRVKRYQDQLRKLNQQITRDLQIARRVQEALVPPGTFRGPRIEIRSAYIPSEMLSGDFYDYFLHDNMMYLFVADVSGHGLPAAILVSLLKSYIHTEADPNTRLSDLMARLNDFLFSVSLPTQFATAQLFRLDAQGILWYANAAHPGFLLFQREQGKVTFLEDPSPLLGALPHMAYDERAVKIVPGDTLFIYTDGLTDRRTEAGEFYSIDRVARLMEKNGEAELNAIYDAILSDVSGFSATEDFRDDIAFIVTRFH
jgi:serine phosphatase RsbU (regulator of sigma subunit)